MSPKNKLHNKNDQKDITLSITELKKNKISAFPLVWYEDLPSHSLQSKFQMARLQTVCCQSRTLTLCKTT